MLSLLVFFLFNFSNAKNLKNVGGKSQKVQDKNKIDISLFLLQNAKYIFWFVILMIFVLILNSIAAQKKELEKMLTTKSTNTKKKDANNFCEFVKKNEETIVSIFEKLKFNKIEQIATAFGNLVSYYNFDLSSDAAKTRIIIMQCFCTKPNNIHDYNYLFYAISNITKSEINLQKLAGMIMLEAKKEILQITYK